MGIDESGIGVDVGGGEEGASFVSGALKHSEEFGFAASELAGSAIGVPRQVVQPGHGDVRLRGLAVAGVAIVLADVLGD